MPLDEPRILALVKEQTNDEGCWFLSATITEAYLQHQLRLLHHAIEGTYEEDGPRIPPSLNHVPPSPEEEAQCQNPSPRHLY